MQVHHFSHGLLNPLLAYTVSVLGCALGLRCTVRAQWSDGTRRGVWLLGGAVAIGGTGIWVMHFIAMLGFSVTGTPIRYNIPYTLLSLLMAIAIVAAGLFIVGFRGTGTVPLLLGGTVTGLGVATMHYLGMAALHLDGRLGYSAGIVALSVLIAVTAATAALWAALRIQGGWAGAGAALVMGVAVCSMHYTGMAAVHVTATTTAAGQDTLPGAALLTFIVPLMTAIVLAAFVLLGAILFDPRLAPPTTRTRDAGPAPTMFDPR